MTNPHYIKSIDFLQYSGLFFCFSDETFKMLLVSATTTLQKWDAGIDF